ncbi:glycosyltransferase family 4 protein [Clostridium perfringens]|uniref:glycosyltransferase family 4 protein n=1 Tax=Clostridium perfringens TaxID=1502 RepID=UPI0039EC4AB6
MEKIIVAHPGRQHSFRLATALKKNDMLYKYITTVYDKKSSFLMRLAKKIINSDNLKRANGRKCVALNDDDVLQFSELRGFIELILIRIDKSKRVYDWWNRRTADVFGKKVANYAIKNNVDIVIMYDSAAYKCFEILKNRAPHIKRIMDSSIANRLYIKEIYENEIKNTGNNSYFYENEYMWNERIMKKFLDEIKNTEYFLVPSKFAKDSYVFSGVNENNIFMVPYGVNISNSKIKKRNYSNKTLKFLFVGQVIARKGIDYLLEAFSEIDDLNIELNIVGSIGKDFEFIKNNKYKNIKVWGLVTHDKMKDIYNECDIFVFPSLAEGMTLSGLEAMGCGLPVICTHNSGISDIIIDGENGFLIPTSDSEAIRKKILWFLKNKDKINKMRVCAYETALKYTWEEYEKNIISEIEKIINL